MTQIPLVDLAWQHERIAARVSEGFAALHASSSYILGPEVETFERAFASYCDVPRCVGVANGTDALELALRAVGVGAGDEVIVPVNTFAATALAVVRAGATPVFADCDPVYLLIDPEDAARRAGPRARAIVPVDLYGQVAPMEAIGALAEHAGLVVVEDAAQAQGARRNGRSAGTFGAAAGTSFYPGKNLGAYGDAGAVLTGSPEIAERVRALRNYGSDVKYHHPVAGFNSRLDSLQAVVLEAKLRHLDDWNALRREAATRYDELLGDLDVVARPDTMPGNEHVWHLYVVRVPRRDDVLASLHSMGIGAGVHYPVPLHLQPAFASLGHVAGEFPVAEAAAAEIISLPMYPGITLDQLEQVAGAVRKAVS